MLREIVRAHDSRITIRPGQHKGHCQLVAIAVLISNDGRIVVSLVVVIVDECENVMVVAITVTAKARAECTQSVPIAVPLSGTRYGRAVFEVGVSAVQCILAPMYRFASLIDYFLHDERSLIRTKDLKHRLCSKFSSLANRKNHLTSLRKFFVASKIALRSFGHMCLAASARKPATPMSIREFK